MTNLSEQIAGEPDAVKVARPVREGADRTGQQCTALAAYFTCIKKSDPRLAAIDAAAFASKNLYNQITYHYRQAFIHEGVWLSYAEVYHRIKHLDCYQPSSARFPIPY